MPRSWMDIRVEADMQQMLGQLVAEVAAVRQDVTDIAGPIGKP